MMHSIDPITWHAKPSGHHHRITITCQLAIMLHALCMTKFAPGYNAHMVAALTYQLARPPMPAAFAALLHLPAVGITEDCLMGGGYGARTSLLPKKLHHHAPQQ